MSKKMANPPVFYTIAQVTFNPVLDMQDFIGALQKRWRREYPDFSQDVVSEIQIHLPTAGGIPEVKTTSKPRWNFKNAENTSCYAVGTNSFTLQTTSYQDSNHFISTMLNGLSDLHKIVELAYTESIGMRMLDAIVTQKGEELTAYLKSDVLGMARKLEGTCKQAISQLQMDTGDGQLLTSRLILLDGQLGIPQELAPLPLTLSAQARAINGPHVVLDNDCRHVKRMTSIDFEDITRRFESAKERLSKAFLETVSEHAIVVWRGHGTATN